MYDFFHLENEPMIRFVSIHHRRARVWLLRVLSTLHYSPEEHFSIVGGCQRRAAPRRGERRDGGTPLELKPILGSFFLFSTIGFAFSTFYERRSTRIRTCMDH